MCETIGASSTLRLIRSLPGVGPGEDVTKDLARMLLRLDLSQELRSGVEFPVVNRTRNLFSEFVQSTR